MQQIYTCQFEQHDGEAIIGFCLNEQCKFPSQFCIQCLKQKHTSHLQDCNTFKDINKFIVEQIIVKEILEKDFISLQESMKKSIDGLIKNTRGQVNRFQELNSILEEQKYFEFKEHLYEIQQYYTQNKRNKNNYTNKITDIVHKFNLLGDKFQSLLSEIIKSQSIKKEINQTTDVCDKLFQQGLQLSGQQKYDEAIQCYDKAISLDPEIGKIYGCKGLALCKQQKYDEAIKCYDKAMLLDPNVAITNFCKGQALGNQQKYDKAIEWYDKSLLLDPNLIVAIEKKGITQNSMRKQYNVINQLLKKGGLKKNFLDISKNIAIYKLYQNFFAHQYQQMVGYEKKTITGNKQN